MNNTIIGTAGHVDHGKTQLIKALTGIDTDRLKEEKKRGITIELGFAYLDLPNGQKAGIIDVPGHERFIKNMLAGAGSIDLALLVVAADEGFMPQTREHLGILSLLGIQRGVIALTKVDLVEPEWLEMVTADIRQEVAGTFLGDAPILPVSSHTGQGLDDLRGCLVQLLALSPSKALHQPFRLPVDRVFPVDGFGTVITGTLVQGTLSDGDEITVFPGLLSTKARNVQVHGETVETAYAGQRVAVNLAGLKYTQVQKGDTLGAPRSMENSHLLDVRLDILPDTGRTIAHSSRLHLYHGTRDVLCRLVLLEEDSLSKGQSGYAQLRLSEPLAAKPGDHFVVRFYSPLETVGGGVILDPCPAKHRRGDAAVLAGLIVKERGTLQERVAQTFLDRSALFPLAGTIRRHLFLEDPGFDQALDALLEDGTLFRIGEEKVIHNAYLDGLGTRCGELLLAYHKDNPLQEGMRREELRAKLLPDREPGDADCVIGLLEKQGALRFNGNRAAHPSFQVSMSDGHKKLADAIRKMYGDGGFSPPAIEEVAAQFPKEKKAFKQTMDALVDEGELVMLTPQICISGDWYQKALEAFSTLAKAQGEVALAQFRDALGTSRKYAVAILEHFDKKGITKKVGDARVLL